MLKTCPLLAIAALAGSSLARAAQPVSVGSAVPPPSGSVAAAGSLPRSPEASPAAERGSTEAGAPGQAPSLAVPLERARLHYEAGQYKPCVRILSAAVKPAAPAAAAPTLLTSSARTYLAACLLASGQVQQARYQFRQAILEDRLMAAPDPVAFPPQVLDLYVEERTALMETLRRQQDDELRRARQLSRERAERQGARVAELERLASTEVVVERGSVWMAWLPFGVGQFQNGDTPLGWVLLTTELGLAATAVAATSIELGLHSAADGGRGQLEPDPLNDNVRLARRVGTVAWTSLIAVALLGGAEARLSFERERIVRSRHRPLPKHLRSPELSPAPNTEVEALGLPGGAWVGVTRRF